MNHPFPLDRGWNARVYVNVKNLYAKALLAIKRLIIMICVDERAQDV